MPVTTAPKLEAFTQTHFPQMEGFGFRTEEVEDKFLRMRLLYHARHLQPGGTISGPALMTLADMAMYSAV